jgi:hypothetical protein
MIGMPYQGVFSSLVYGLDNAGAARRPCQGHRKSLQSHDTGFVRHSDHSDLPFVDPSWDWTHYQHFKTQGPSIISYAALLLLLRGTLSLNPHIPDVKEGVKYTESPT